MSSEAKLDYQELRVRRNLEYRAAVAAWLADPLQASKAAKLGISGPCVDPVRTRKPDFEDMVAGVMDPSPPVELEAPAAVSASRAARAVGVLGWLIEPRSVRLRSNRSVALVLAAHGVSWWGVGTIEEVSALEGVPVRSLRALREELRTVYGVGGPRDVSAACGSDATRGEGVGALDVAKNSPDGERQFFAGPGEL